MALPSRYSRVTVDVCLHGSIGNRDPTGSLVGRQLRAIRRFGIARRNRSVTSSTSASLGHQDRAAEAGTKVLAGSVQR